MSRWAKFARWWKGNWPTVLLGILGAGGLSALVAVIGDVIAIGTQYPMPLGAFGVFMFVCGMAFAHLVGLRDWIRAKNERRYAERIEAEEKERRERELEEHKAVSFKTAQFEAKMLACLAFDEGYFDNSSDFVNGDTSWQYDARKMLVQETISNNQVRYTLKPDVSELLKLHPELIEEARKELNVYKNEE